MEEAQQLLGRMWRAGLGAFASTAALAITGVHSHVGLRWRLHPRGRGIVRACHRCLSLLAAGSHTVRSCQWHSPQAWLLFSNGCWMCGPLVALSALHSHLVAGVLCCGLRHHLARQQGVEHVQAASAAGQCWGRQHQQVCDVHTTPNSWLQPPVLNCMPSQKDGPRLARLQAAAHLVPVLSCVAQVDVDCRRRQPRQCIGNDVQLSRL